MAKRLEPYLPIVAGGFAGASACYALGEAVPGMYGILVVNVAGCFLPGFLMYESIYIGAFSFQTRLAYGVGLLGAFTTFSTFSFRTFEAGAAGYRKGGRSWSYHGAKSADAKKKSPELF